MPTKSICSVDGCDKHARSAGRCHPHYMRWRRHGDATAGRTAVGDPERFILEVAAKHTGDECLIWPFSNKPDGYAEFWREGRSCIASRVVCELVNGPPPTTDHDAAHDCGKGNEGCVSGGHLSWKTHAANLADRERHGTSRKGKPRPILTLSEARSIRALAGKKPMAEVASMFGVTRQTVSNIQRGLTWAGID